MKKYRNILIVCLLLLLISCKGKSNVSQNIEQQPDTSKSTQIMPGEEPSFISDGCINITKGLDVRDSPTIDGKILY